jgi:hypothetical protein
MRRVRSVGRPHPDGLGGDVLHIEAHQQAEDGAEQRASRCPGMSARPRQYRSGSEDLAAPLERVLASESAMGLRRTLKLETVLE